MYSSQELKNWLLNLEFNNSEFEKQNQGLMKQIITLKTREVYIW